MAQDTNGFSRPVTEKYELNPSLQAGVIDFGYYYHGEMMDLRQVAVATVDAFVKKYPYQEYFKLKKKGDD